MPNSNLQITIQFKTEGKNEIETLISSLSKEYSVSVNVDTEKVNKGTQQIQIGFKNFFSQFGFIVQGLREMGAIIEQTGRILLEPASQFEQLRVRLVNLYQDQEKANQAFETFKEIAETTPYEMQNVVAAGIQLKSFGLNAENTLKSVADLAAFMGTDVTEAASAVGRAFAGGVGAADVLRERGVLELVKSFKGIDDLTKLTLPEFRKALLETFQDPAAGIAGATTKLSKTYFGAVSNMKDALFSLRAEIGEKLLPTLEKGVKSATSFFRSLTEMPLERTIRELKELNATTEDVLKLEILSWKLELESINLELKKAGVNYNNISDISAELANNREKQLQIKLAESKLIANDNLTWTQIKNIYMDLGFMEEEAVQKAELWNSMTNERGKALNMVLRDVQEESKQLQIQEESLGKYYDQQLMREALEKKINTALEDRTSIESTEPFNLIDPEKIAKAQQEVANFFLSLQNAHDKLQTDYENKKSLIETAFVGNPDKIKSETEKLTQWYQSELEKINNIEIEAAEKVKRENIRIEEEKYQNTLKVLHAKKELGLLVDAELMQAQQAYLNFLKQTFGEESLAYIQAKANMETASKRFHDNEIAEWQRNHEFASGVISSIGAGFRTFFDNFFDRSKSGLEMLNAGWLSLKNSFMNAIGDMAKEFIEKQLIMFLAKKTTENASRAETIKTAAVEKASLLSTIALNIKAALSKIWQTIAKVFNWFISVFGPIAGPAMAVGTSAAIIALFNGFRKQLGFAAGGLFRGIGGPRDDKNLIAVSDGEYIVNSEATKRYLPLLNVLNYGNPALIPTPITGYAATGGYIDSGNSLEIFEQILFAVRNLTLSGTLTLKDDRSAVIRHQQRIDDEDKYNRIYK